MSIKGASQFSLSKTIFNRQFILILNLFIMCYNSILQNEKIKKGHYNENMLRNMIISYAKLNKSKLGLGHILIEGEVGIFDKNYYDVGRTDIRIYNLYSLVTSGYVDETDYYTIECKRIDASKYSITQYIDEGLVRFSSGKYSSNADIAGMISFIEQGNISNIITRINQELTNSQNIVTIQQLKKYNVNQNFLESYFSIHKRIRLKDVDIYHLFLDYQQIII